MKKQIIVSIFSAALLFSLTAQPLMAASDSTLPAGFDVMGPAVVTVDNPDSDMFYGENQSVSVNVDLTPTGTTFADNFSIIFGAYYDTDASDGPSEPEWMGSLGNSQLASALYSWDAVLGVTLLSNSAGSSWIYNGVTFPTTDQSIGEFVFNFAPGKVARETFQLPDGIWQFCAQVVVVKPGGNLVTNGFDPTPADMQLYTEFVSGPTGVNWGTVEPGMNFASTPPSLVTLDTSVQVIANGSYQLGVRTDSLLWGDPSAEVQPVLAYGMPGANEFGILVGLNSDLEFGGQQVLTLTDTALSSFAITGESGTNLPFLHAFLALGNPFPAGAFNGNIILSLSSPLV